MAEEQSLTISVIKDDDNNDIQEQELKDENESDEQVDAKLYGVIQRQIMEDEGGGEVGGEIEEGEGIGDIANNFGSESKIAIAAIEHDDAAMEQDQEEKVNLVEHQIFKEGLSRADCDVNITFNSKPLGFTLRGGKNDINAWIIRINENNEYKSKGLKTGLFVSQVNNKIVDNESFYFIKGLIEETKAPLYIGFNYKSPKDDNNGGIEILFDSKPLGITLRGDQQKDGYFNAYVAKIKENGSKYIENGLCEGLYIHKINEYIADNQPFNEIKNQIKESSLPIRILFHESPPESTKEIEIPASVDDFDDEFVVIKFTEKPLGFTVSSGLANVKSTQISRVVEDNKYIKDGLEKGLYVRAIGLQNVTYKGFEEVTRLLKNMNVPMNVKFSRYLEVGHGIRRRPMPSSASCCCITLGCIMCFSGAGTRNGAVTIALNCVGIIMMFTGICYYFAAKKSR